MVRTEFDHSGGTSTTRTVTTSTPPSPPSSVTKYRWAPDSKFNTIITNEEISELPIYTLSSLSLCPDLVGIDGFVFDLIKISASHPGGDITKMLGGIDATLHYYTNHPFHDHRQLQILKKYLVGRLLTNHSPIQAKSEAIKSGLITENDINNPSKDCWDHLQYDLNTPFGKDLVTSVKNYFINNDGTMRRSDATYGWYIRAILIALLWIWSEYNWAMNPSIWRGILSGCIIPLAGLMIPHEANHWTINHSKNYSYINDVLGWFMDMLGQSRYLWLQVHSFSHHLFVNHVACDHDVNSGEPFLSFDANEAAEMKNKRIWFRWAAGNTIKKTAVFLFFLQFYRWVMMVDVNALLYMYKYRKETDPNTNSDTRRINRPTPWLLDQRPLTLIIRFFHVIWSYGFLFYAIYSSIRSGHYSIAASLLFAVYLRDMFVSLLLSLLFLVSHNFDGAHRSRPSTEKGILPTNPSDPIPTEPIRDWYREQIEGSANYGGLMMIWFTGGLSHQIEHHCFPKMNSAHFPQVGKIVREVCKRHHVKYKHFPTIVHAWISMFKHLLNIHTE